MTSANLFTGAPDLHGKPNALKQHNLRYVISLLQDGDASAAAQLSAQTGLSKTTISKILSELCARNLVRSAGKGDSATGNGKKPEFFTINATYALTIVLSLFGREGLRCSVVDLCGNVWHEADYGLPQEGGYPALLDVMRTALHHAFSHAGADAHRICGIAIGYGGTANTDLGEILYPPCSAEAQFCPVCADLAGSVPEDVMIYVDNIGHFSGYAELMFEKEKDVSRIAVISCGEVINGSTLSASQQRPGNRGIVGEFGHFILNPASPTTCYCGSKGCLESLISERAILAYGRKIAPDYPFSALAVRAVAHEIGIDDILSALGSRDRFAEAVFAPVCDYLSILIRNLVVLQSVSKVIIQGSYVRAGEDFLNGLKARVNRYCSYATGGDFPIEYSRWSLQGPEADKKACVYGAARYTSNFYLDNLVAEWFSA
ncbi:MAG: ROK family protein [Roseburia sp.]|jgi:predicted NBD/HSP70 family sugar kinase|nr:ROK family protein [Roseburia sp.]